MVTHTFRAKAVLKIDPPRQRAHAEATDTEDDLVAAIKWRQVAERIACAAMESSVCRFVQAFGNDTGDAFVRIMVLESMTDEQVHEAAADIARRFHLEYGVVLDDEQKRRDADGFRSPICNVKITPLD
jgi:hypothetical protein